MAPLNAKTAARAVDQIETAIDTKSYKPFYKRRNGILLYFLLSSSFLSSLATGFDGSMTNSMQLLDRWQNDFGHPKGASLGLFGASTSIGGVVPLIFFGWTSDRFGRRFGTVVGALLIICGTFVEAWAKTLAIYTGGKVILGAGASFVQTGAPVLITEMCHPKERAIVTSLYNTSVVLGYVIGAWVTFGVVKIESVWQWRLPTLLQALPSIYQLSLIYFSPESPRWLIARGEEEKARQLPVKYHGEGDPNSELVYVEMEEIKQAIQLDRENNMTWRDFFGSKANLKRIVLCTATACFSQTTGNLLISNFLNQILVDTGLKSNFDRTLVNGMITLWSYIVSIATGLLIDRFPRRYFFLGGCGASLITFIVWTIAAKEYSVDGSMAAGHLVIACIFFYQAFYTIAWVNLVVTYPLEIVTYQMRAKAWTYTLLVIQCSQIFGNYVNPVGMEAIGWKFYIYICVWTLIAWLFVYFFFPETRGPTLEELTLLFEDGGNIVHNKKALVDRFLPIQKEVADIDHQEKQSLNGN